MKELLLAGCETQSRPDIRTVYNTIFQQRAATLNFLLNQLKHTTGSLSLSVFVCVCTMSLDEGISKSIGREMLKKDEKK